MSEVAAVFRAERPFLLLDWCDASWMAGALLEIERLVLVRHPLDTSWLLGWTRRAPVFILLRIRNRNTILSLPLDCIFGLSFTLRSKWAILFRWYSLLEAFSHDCNHLVNVWKPFVVKFLVSSLLVQAAGLLHVNFIRSLSCGEEMLVVLTYSCQALRWRKHGLIWWVLLKNVGLLSSLSFFALTLLDISPLLLVIDECVIYGRIVVRSLIWWISNAVLSKRVVLIVLIAGIWIKLVLWISLLTVILLRRSLRFQVLSLGCVMSYFQLFSVSRLFNWFLITLSDLDWLTWVYSLLCWFSKEVADVFVTFRAFTFAKAPPVSQLWRACFFSLRSSLSAWVNSRMLLLGLLWYWYRSPRALSLRLTLLTNIILSLESFRRHWHSWKRSMSVVHQQFTRMIRGCQI